MFDIPTLAIAVPALPLAATLATAALGPRILRGRSHVPVITALALAFLASVALLVQVDRQSRGGAVGPNRRCYERIVTVWRWASIPGAYEVAVSGRGGGSELPTARLPSPAPSSHEGRELRVGITLRADSLSAVMLVTVTLIALVVAVYSVGYMHGDPGYWRFFTYIGLFVFSMTMLVSVSNFVLLYVFWEAVGLCSYLLIGFWFHKPEAAAAGKKAFLVNRVGDFGFALGIFLIWLTYGTLDFHDPLPGSAAAQPGVLGAWRLADPSRYAGGAVGTAIALLLMLGACGKSAQMPLHVWLPDAMEGPTPVSALIHAATMVTAGVYMVARCAPLFAASSDALLVVALVGALTALVAAVIAVTQTDLKRILAYSTISQLGYMFLGLGTGSALGVIAAMFHLVTHAFFKSLLFLGAGSVMHAMGGVIDIRQLGGLRQRLPITCWTFVVGALALAGVVPLAGFWSKDAILAAVHHQATVSLAPGLYHGLYWLALATAAITAFYTFRAVFVVFYGRERIPREAGEHAEESPTWITGPLVFLALGTVVVGAGLEKTGSLKAFLGQAPPLVFLTRHAHTAEAAAGHLGIAVWSTAAAAVGIGLAWLLYVAAPGLSPLVAAVMRRLGLYGLSAGKFYFDALYGLLVVRPLQALASLSAWLDRWVVDGLVELAGLVPKTLGGALRPLQRGLIPWYALAMLVAVLLLLGSLLTA